MVPNCFDAKWLALKGDCVPLILLTDQLYWSGEYLCFQFKKQKKLIITIGLEKSTLGWESKKI